MPRCRIPCPNHAPTHSNIPCCSVCPFMVVGELAQSWKAAVGGSFAKWPKKEAEQMGPWAMIALFAGGRAGDLAGAA